VDVNEGGKKVELDDVYRLYVNDLYRYLFSLSKDHYTAEDLVQEAFYRAYLQMEDYEIRNIKAWLFKVSYRAFIDYKRKHKRLVISEDVEDVMIHSLQTPETEMLEQESFQLLLEDIHSLREKEKNVLLLCDLHQLSYQEAADVLDMKLNTLKSDLLRGRKKVMKRVKERMARHERR